jgi:uncharacterized protein YbbK (DUF523 family)
MYLVSACLIGMNTTHTGKNNANQIFEDMLRRGEVVPICPEQLGGLTTPRPLAEIVGGTGNDVLAQHATVQRKDGTDVTQAFIRGAREVLELANKLAPAMVILKERSPSCGVHFIYDGTFSQRVISGTGVTTALLQKHGFAIISDEEYLKQLLDKERDEK